MGLNKKIIKESVWNRHALNRLRDGQQVDQQAAVVTNEVKAQMLDILYALEPWFLRDRRIRLKNRKKIIAAESEYHTYMQELEAGYVKRLKEYGEEVLVHKRRRQMVEMTFTASILIDGTDKRNAFDRQSYG